MLYNKTIMPPHVQAGSRPAPYRVAQLHLFDTCTQKCGYCWFAESGQVVDLEQLARYRDPDFIQKVRDFFLKRTSDKEKWLLALTGGEPLIAPNFDRLFEPLLAAGNKICVYTGLIVGKNHPGFQFLLKHDSASVEYVTTSFHPEGERQEEAYFERIRMLKDRGHNLMFRLISHPARIHRIPELAERCRELDICFDPSPLFSNRYPAAYTEADKDQMREHFSSLFQHIRLEGGIDTTDTDCFAGSRILAANLQTGNITPCISVDGPSIGNVFEDRLQLYPDAIRCPKPGISCICEVHFQQNVVPGASDRDAFERQLQGYAPSRPFDVELAELKAAGLRFHTASHKGIGEIQDDERLFFTLEEVQESYRRNHGKPRTAMPGRDLVELAEAVGSLIPAGEGSTIEKGSPTRIVTAPGRWWYAAAVPLEPPAGTPELWVRVRARVVAGEAGFGLLNRAGDAFQERFFIPPSASRVTMYLHSADPSDLTMLIIENSSAAGKPTEVELLDVTVLARAPEKTAA
jgi:organic radical activating enzyme